jgi:lipopolysaccharide biosynthesis regulator YciM
VGGGPNSAFDPDNERLDELSNGTVDMIVAGKLDEAERMCQQLLADFPDVIDGHLRLGHLYRVRGDTKKAAEHMRLAAAMARTPDYDPEVAEGLDAEADKIDPPP